MTRAVEKQKFEGMVPVAVDFGTTALNVLYRWGEVLHDVYLGDPLLALKPISISGSYASAQSRCIAMPLSMRVAGPSTYRG